VCIDEKFVPELPLSSCCYALNSMPIRSERRRARDRSIPSRQMPVNYVTSAAEMIRARHEARMHSEETMLFQRAVSPPRSCHHRSGIFTQRSTHSDMVKLFCYDRDVRLRFAILTAYIYYASSRLTATSLRQQPHSILSSSAHIRALFQSAPSRYYNISSRFR